MKLPAAVSSSAGVYGSRRVGTAPDREGSQVTLTPCEEHCARSGQQVLGLDFIRHGVAAKPSSWTEEMTEADFRKVAGAARGCPAAAPAAVRRSDRSSRL
jgi:hypothetical protein